MEKRLPIPIESESSVFNNQFKRWLHDSHNWIQKSSVVYVCKWCGMLMPMALNQSTLCLKNPEIMKIIAEQEFNKK